MKTVNVAGRQLSLDLTAWPAADRRFGSLVILGAMIVLVLAGSAVWFLTLPEVALWILVVLAATLLVFQGLIVLLGARAERAIADIPDMPEDAAPHEGPAHPGTPPWSQAPPGGTASAPEIITLKCGDCGTLFDVEDFGVRPLRHTCPGCGAEGVLRGEPAEAPPAAPADHAAWAPPAEAPPAKRLKLRCGGCSQVFVLEDTGMRPLRSACPHCGRLGEIR